MIIEHFQGEYPSINATKELNKSIKENKYIKIFLISGNDIRKFAMEKLKNSNSPAIYTNLLISNSKQSDAKLLTSLATKCKSEDTIHDFVFSYIEIYKVNKTRECKAPLEAIYDKLTCGIHRNDIVKILLENKVLSKKIRQEIKYDSSEETRRLSNEK